MTHRSGRRPATGARWIGYVAACVAAALLSACFPITADYFQPESAAGKVSKETCHGTVGPLNTISFDHEGTRMIVQVFRAENAPTAVDIEVVIVKLPGRRDWIEIAPPVLTPDDTSPGEAPPVRLSRLRVDAGGGRTESLPIPDNRARISALRFDAFLSYQATIGTSGTFTLMLPRVDDDVGRLILPAQTIRYTVRRTSYLSPINC